MLFDLIRQLNDRLDRRDEHLNQEMQKIKADLSAIKETSRHNAAQTKALGQAITYGSGEKLLKTVVSETAEDVKTLRKTVDDLIKVESSRPSGVSWDSLVVLLSNQRFWVALISIFGTAVLAWGTVTGIGDIEQNRQEEKQLDQQRLIDSL